MSVSAFFGSLLAIIVALIFVLGLAWLAIRGLRHWQDRFQRTAEEAGRPLRFLRAMPLGQNERVALIEVEGEVMLVGVATGSVTLLARWPQTDGSDAE